MAIDSSIKNINHLRDLGVTLTVLAVLAVIDQPLDIRTASEKSGVSLRAVERMIDRYPKLFRRVKYSGKQPERGSRISYAIARTKAAAKLLGL